MPLTLGYGDSNFKIWSVFFDAVLCKFGLLDHVDGSVDAQSMWHDHERLQVDQCIVSWLYLTVTSDLMKMVVVEQPSAFLLWSAIRGLFLDNSNQRAVYTLQEFHSLFQGNLSINRLKNLGDLMRDVGHAVSEPSKVLNALDGLSSKFSHTIPILTACHPLTTFSYVRDYLQQDKACQAHTAKMEAASALMATASAAGSGMPTPPRPPATNPSSPPSYLPTKKSNNNKKRK